MTRPFFFLFLSIFFVASLSLTSVARAQFFTGPAASGMGGAGRAAIDLGESAFLNPAGVAFLHGYNASAYYGQGQHPNAGEHNIWGVSLADGSRGNIVSGALTYVRERVDQANRFSDTRQDWQIALAGFPLQKLALGVAGHRLTNQILSAASAGSEHTQTNAHIGLIFVPIVDFGVGFVAYDVLPTADSVPADVRLVPTHALAFNYLYEKVFRMRLDLVRPDTRNDGRRINVMLGTETYFHESFALRLGGRWQETDDRTYFTTGFGYIGPRFSFDYSFQKDVRAGDNNRHLIDLWMPL